MTYEDSSERRRSRGLLEEGREKKGIADETIYAIES